MPQTPQHPANALTAVDYFKAKLQFESTPAALRSILDKESVLAVDVRDAGAWARGRIPGAVNLPLEALPARLEELPKDKTIVVYAEDETSPKATKAALDLAHRDYKVQELLGGFSAWKRAGFPVDGAPVGRA